MFGWLRGRKLDAVLYETKTVWVHGVRFRIRKINPLDYMAGSKAIRQIYQTYQAQSSENIEVKDAHAREIKAHYADLFMGSVVEPKLKRKTDDMGEGIPVDHLMTDWDLATELYGKIYEFTYGKKKLSVISLVQGRCIEIDAIAKRYGVRPSDIIKGDISDLCLDLLVASKAIEHENKEQEKAARKAKARRHR